VLRLQTRVLLAALLTSLLTAGVLGVGRHLDLGWPAAAAAAAVVALMSSAIGATLATSPARQAMRALHDGVMGFAESDFATRLAMPSPDEMGDLVDVFNRMGAVLRQERADLIQRELLLDTLLQGAPMAILLLDQRERIVFANTACRRVFRGATRLNGRLLADLIAHAPAALHAPLAQGEDSLVTWEEDGHEESYRLLVRGFHLNTMAHRVLVIERITSELARQEAAVWKKAIRVMSHELNNSLAPISSLAHSARVAADRPDAATRLPPLLDTIAERVAHVTGFLEGYARFARLPAPRPSHVPLAPFLEGVARLFPFTLDGDSGTRQGWFDAAQLQQVLINLLKNAEESGSPAADIRVHVEGRDDGVVLTVLDRGTGMDDDLMRKALLPFHSFKKSGAGLGLSLCSEIVEAHGGRLRLARRPGGGLAVSVWLPALRGAREDLARRPQDA